MTRSPLLAPFAIYVVLAGVAFAARPLAPDEAMKGFQLADAALTVELVAGEPFVESPCAMAFNEKGWLYVAENRGYPNTSSPAQGRIALLRDTNADGRMDERTTFAEGLTFPNGVLPWRDGVIVTCAPDVLFLKDTNGDGVADERRVLLTGFATTGSTQLRVNAPTLGPDGWIYLAAGLSGGSITSPEHPTRAPLKMTADLRFHPETLEVEHVDGRSQYGMGFDDFGRRFICMNRLPVQHVVLSSRWLRRNPQLAFSNTVQDCHDRDVKTGLRGGGNGVRLFPISSNITTADSHAGSFSAACGVFVWAGGALGAAYEGAVFSCDPTGNLVHADRLKPQGATYAATPVFADREFLASKDDWFRPVAISSGPDGALYVADMYRKVIEHPDYLPQEVRKRTDFESGKAHGRIWRVVARDAAREYKEPSLNSNQKQIDALSDPRGWWRQTAFRLLLEIPPRVASLRSALGQANPAGTTAILNLLAIRRSLDAEALQIAANATDPSLREVALKLWMEQTDRSIWLPDPAVIGNEPDARVRFIGALALGEIPEGTAALASIGVKDATDRWTRAAVLSSINGRAGEFMEAFLETAPQIDSGASNILRGLARSFANVAELRSAIERLNTGLEAGRDGIGLVLDSLLLGVTDRSGERLAPKADDKWLGAIVDGSIDIASRPDRGTFERALCIELLGRTSWEKAGAILLKLAREEKDETLRTAAVRAAAGFPEREVTHALLAPGEWTRATPAQRELLLDALLLRGAHAAGVLDAVEEGRLPANAIPANRRAVLLKVGDKTLRARAETLFQKGAGDRQAAFESGKAALALVPKPERGRELFQQFCATCHRLDRAGHAVGPDLFDIRNQPKENILFHIVVPDAEIAPAFAAYMAETTDGRAVAGIMASETPSSITLRGPLAQDTSLLRSELKALQSLPNSLMPAGLEQAMSAQDMADLLAYLKGE